MNNSSWQRCWNIAFAQDCSPMLQFTHHGGILIVWLYCATRSSMELDRWRDCEDDVFRMWSDGSCPAVALQQGQGFLQCWNTCPYLLVIKSTDGERKIGGIILTALLESESISLLKIFFYYLMISTLDGVFNIGMYRFNVNNEISLTSFKWIELYIGYIFHSKLLHFFVLGMGGWDTGIARRLTFSFHVVTGMNLECWISYLVVILIQFTQAGHWCLSEYTLENALINSYFCKDWKCHDLLHGCFLCIFSEDSLN